MQADGCTWYLPPHLTPNVNRPYRPFPPLTLNPTEQDEEDPFLKELIPSCTDPRRALALPWGSQRVAWEKWPRQDPDELRKKGSSGTYRYGIFDESYDIKPTGAPRVDPERPNARVRNWYPKQRKWIPTLETLPDDHILPVNGDLDQMYWRRRADIERLKMEKMPKPRPEPKKKRGNVWCTHIPSGGKCKDCMTDEDIAAIQNKRMQLATRGFWGRKLSGLTLEEDGKGAASDSD